MIISLISLCVAVYVFIPIRIIFLYPAHINYIKEHGLNISKYVRSRLDDDIINEIIQDARWEKI